MARLKDLPLLVILMGIGAAAMLVPAGYAYGQRDMHVARVFFYGAVLFGMLTAIIAIAASSSRPANPLRSHLLALVGAWLALPLMLALPFQQAVRDTSFLNAYFEMVSSLTTTGATLFDPPERLSEALHLWRALVGWLGGFMMWVLAISIMAPLNLGGFELTSSGGIGAGGPLEGFDPGGGGGDGGEGAVRRHRLMRYSRRLLPVYIGLTLLLWLGLTLAGDRSFVALCHAMATMSTSGISPVGGLEGAGAGLGGEMLIFAFLLFAITRRSFLSIPRGRFLSRLGRDPELRLAFWIVSGLAVVLFLRHFIAALDLDAAEDPAAAAHALWGGAFTVLSFLTTNGFTSASWDAAQGWSGMNTSGLVLVGLALIGGGVGTTAGGVKLLRVIVLYRHGAREIERMVYPSSVQGARGIGGHLRRNGAFIAWVGFSLFAFSIALVMILLSLAGLDFEASSIFSIAAFTTTGPLAGLAGDHPLAWSDIGTGAKAILIPAMVLGRLGTLTIIALLNPDLWRR